MYKAHLAKYYYGFLVVRPNIKAVFSAARRPFLVAAIAFGGAALDIAYIAYIAFVVVAASAA